MYPEYYTFVPLTSCPGLIFVLWQLGCHFSNGLACRTIHMLSQFIFMVVSLHKLSTSKTNLLAFVFYLPTFRYASPSSSPSGQSYQPSIRSLFPSIPSPGLLIHHRVLYVFKICLFLSAATAIVQVATPCHLTYTMVSWLLSLFLVSPPKFTFH